MHWAKEKLSSLATGLNFLAKLHSLHSFLFNWEADIQYVFPFNENRALTNKVFVFL